MGRPQPKLSAGFVREREHGLVVLCCRVGGGCIQVQLLLAAEHGDAAAIRSQMPLRGLEGFLSLIQILADVLKLALEVIE
jgi:hypothetical protein